LIGFGLGILLYASVAFVFNSLTSGMIPIHYYLFSTLIVIAVLVAIIFSAVLFPVKKALTLEPAVALRHE
jgi:ABC-type antimicrobial peptide transport system permease subunit